MVPDRLREQHRLATQNLAAVTASEPGSSRCGHTGLWNQKDTDEDPQWESELHDCACFEAKARDFTVFFQPVTHGEETAESDGQPISAEAAHYCPLEFITDLTSDRPWIVQVEIIKARITVTRPQDFTRPPR